MQRALARALGAGVRVHALRLCVLFAYACVHLCMRMADVSACLLTLLAGMEPLGTVMDDNFRGSEMFILLIFLPLPFIFNIANKSRELGNLAPARVLSGAEFPQIPAGISGI